jgi:hypothetical protein
VRIFHVHPAYAHGMNAGERHLRAAHADVGRGKPQRPSELLAPDDAAAHRIWPAQQIPRASELPRGERGAHAAGTHAHVVEAHRRHQLERELARIGRGAQ